MRNTLPFLIITSFSLLASCSPSRQSDSISSSVQYEGESTVRVYQVMMDMETSKPLSARFDIEFTAKNGEPIMDLDKRNRLRSELNPDLSCVTSEAYSIDGYFYDLDCKNFVWFDDIATENLNLFYCVISF